MTQKRRFAVVVLMSILGVVVQAGIVQGITTAATAAAVFKT